MSKKSLSAAARATWSMVDHDPLLSGLKRLHDSAGERLAVGGRRVLKGDDNAARQAVELLERTRGMQQHVKMLHYAYTMNICRMCGAPKDALRVLSLMELDERTPSAEMYASALWAHSKQTDLPGAVDVWKAMRRANVTPDAGCYAALMNTISRDALLEERCSDATRQRLLKAFKAMVDGGGVPTKAHYTALIRHASDEAAALELFRYCYDEGYRVDQGLSTGLLRFYQSWTQGRGEREVLAAVRRYLDILGKHSVPITDLEAAGVILLYRTHGCHAEADAFWEEDVRLRGTARMTPRLLFNLLENATGWIEALASGGGKDDVAKLHEVRGTAMARFEELRALAPLRTSPNVWLALLRVLMAAGDRQAAKDLLALIATEGVQYHESMNGYADQLGVPRLTTDFGLQVKSHISRGDGTYPEQWYNMDTRR